MRRWTFENVKTLPLFLISLWSPKAIHSKSGQICFLLDGLRLLLTQPRLSRPYNILIWLDGPFKLISLAFAQCWVSGITYYGDNSEHKPVQPSLKPVIMSWGAVQRCDQEGAEGAAQISEMTGQLSFCCLTLRHKTSSHKTSSHKISGH